MTCVIDPSMGGIIFHIDALYQYQDGTKKRNGLATHLSGGYFRQGNCGDSNEHPSKKIKREFQK